MLQWLTKYSTCLALLLWAPLRGESDDGDDYDDNDQSDNDSDDDDDNDDGGDNGCGVFSL